MNYEFPIIRNINDVLPAIQGRDEFVVADKGSYTVINYNVMMADTFPDVETDFDEFSSSVDPNIAKIRRECRGIIFDTATGDIIRRPFHKFFNVNEREETQDHVVDLSRPHAILEKLDGSMCSVFAHEGKLVWGTKMVAHDFHEMIEQFVSKSEINYEEFCWELINSRHTPIFEWMHPQKRIVIDYGKEPTLILTAIREIESGRYLSQDAVHDLALGYYIPVVRAFEPQTDMKAFLDYVRDLEDLEGFVVRFDDGHMLKLKCHWYLQIHKAKEAILQDRNIVEIILNEKLDDVKAHLPAEDRDRLTQFESDFNHAFNWVIANILGAHKEIEASGIDRKTFALTKSASYDQYTRPILFRMFGGHVPPNLREIVADTIRSNLGRTAKYEALRDVWFPGIAFN